MGQLSKLTFVGNTTSSESSDMATIETRTNKNGKVSYRVKIRLDGCKPVNRTFDRLTDAKQWLQRTEADMRRGIHLPTAENTKRTLADLIDRYIQEELPKRRSDQKKYAMMLGVWKEKLGFQFLRDILPARIAEVRNWLSNEPIPKGRRSPQTVKHYLNALSACLVWGMRDLNWLEENPVSKTQKPSTARNGRIRYLSEDERSKLLTAAKASKSPYLYPLVVLALSTGARLGEMLSLKWSEVDLKKGTVLFKDTKNGDSRTVPLGQAACSVLKTLRYDRPITPNQLVFEGKNGTPADTRAAWEAALKNSCIENFHFHDLRHTAASYMAMEGVDMLRMAEILGHRTLQMTKRYAHLAPQHTKSAIDKLDAKLFGSTIMESVH
jgi:integrase